MTPTPNAVDTENVHEEVIDGDRHLVAEDVQVIKPMNLAGGYVPAAHVAASAAAWDGQPLGVNHPRDHAGRVVSFDSPTGEEAIVGHARDPTAHPDGSVTVDLEVNADRASGMGAEASDIVQALEGGDPLSVSTQYFADELSAGVYDGRERAEVEGNLDPDGIALLPNKPGKCSLADGCGFAADAATANVADGLRVPALQTDDPTGARSSGSELYETMNANAMDVELTDTQPDAVGGYTDAEWDGDAVTAALPNPSDDEDAPATLDATHLLHPTGEEARDEKASWILPFRAGPDEPVNTRALIAAIAAINGARGGVDAPMADLDGAHSRVVDFLVDAPDDLFGSVQEAADAPAFSPSGNVLSRIGRAVANRLGLDGLGEQETETMPAESGVDADPDDHDMDRDARIEALVANTDLKRASLEGMGDQCLANVYEHRVASNDADDSPPDGGDGGGADEDTPTDMTNDDESYVTREELDQALDDAVSGLADEVAERVTANQADSEQTKLAETIVANSAEYDEVDAVREDYPTTAALQAKRDTLDTSPIGPAGNSVAGAEVGDDVDTEDLPSGVME